MPAKQVYGRRTTAKTTTSFSKFISPDKDVAVATAGKKNVRATRKEEVEELEKEMDGLALVDADKGIDAAPAKKSRRARRVVFDDEDDSEKAEEANPPANVDVVDLTHQLDSLGFEADGKKTQQKESKKKGRPKKASKEVEEPENDIDIADQVDDLALRSDGSKAHSENVQITGRSNKSSSKGVETKADAKPVVRSDKQTEPPRKHAGEQSPPNAPAQSRRLKAVVIPRRSTSSRMSLPPTPDPTPEQDIYAAYASPLLSLSYEKKVVSFETWSSALEPHFAVTKIAEASYSEVYRLTASSTTAGSATESVLKLVALKTPPNAPLFCQAQARRSRDPEKQAKKELEAREEQDQWKSHVDDVHSEVKLLQNLNDIPGFTNFRELTVLQGRPSASFARAWKSWNKTRPRDKKSEFPDPGKKTSYDDTQLWAVVEMHDAGTDCEKVMDAGGVSSIWEVWDVFWGVCLSVAKAEETCKFEHRDLHLENICIRSSRSRVEDDLLNPIIKDPLRRKLGFTGLDTTVIDYTLSRADVLPSSLTASTAPSSPTSAASTSSSNPDVAYLDLEKDLTLFEASGEYQYEIYRYMRGVVLHNNPLHHRLSPTPSPEPRRSPLKTPQHIRFDSSSSDNSNPPPPPEPFPQKHATNSSSSDPWRPFHPKTNLVWAHFILHQLLAHLEAQDYARRSDKQLMRNVEARVEDSARVAKRARKLAKVLERASALLEPQALAGDGGLGSVKELVVLAMEERWLRVEDVAGG